VGAHADVFQAWLRLSNSCRASETTHEQALVSAECRCTTDLQSLLSGPHSAVTAQITLASDARTRFVPAGSARVSLPPLLCTWLPGFRSSARVTPQRTSTTAFFDYISAGRCTHCALYHWRPHLYSDCCIGHRRRCKLSAADWRPNCLPDLTAVLSLTKNFPLHWLLRDFTVIVTFVTFPCSVRT